MRDDDILILKGHEVESLLADKELEVIDVTRVAYETHARGESSLPHSTFLRFPDHQKNRIIALPAYLGGGFGVAGLKWVSSFPDNINKNLNRASAVIILNSASTGRPEAIIEGSLISAKRTAASAALAARTLLGGRQAGAVGLLGCGPINLEVARFINAACAGVEKLLVFDLDENRAREFKEKFRGVSNKIVVEVVGDWRTVFRETDLISLATTAVSPHIFDLSECRPGSIILHVSLRDIGPEALLACDNVVDDVDHVSRAQTSIHLAEQLTGNRDFIRCTLADILLGRAATRKDKDSVAVFSPFGLGILDLAVAGRVRELAVEQNKGTVINSFLPDSQN